MAAHLPRQVLGDAAEVRWGVVQRIWIRKLECQAWLCDLEQVTLPLSVMLQDVHRG